jgi:hypothetical protein
MKAVRIPLANQKGLRKAKEKYERWQNDDLEFATN